VCAYVHVGERTVLHPNVVIYERSVVGNDCILHAGVIIGADGFGYHPRPDGRGVIKIPHIGNVVIHENVEIGANSCVDKGKFGSTVIGAGTKIDNLVQIGHNCQLGRSCILCGECGLSGSVKLGDGVVLGGRVGVADNVSIGSGARVGAYSGVSNDIPPGAVYLGVPAGPANEWKRIYGFLRRLGKNRGKPVW
jgi:UDP-3-O-[3-hydroxymyristoyl] glucosamine N-acyltransferase